MLYPCEYVGHNRLQHFLKYVIHHLFIYASIYPLFNDVFDKLKHRPSNGRNITGE